MSSIHTSETTRMALDHTDLPHSMCLHCDGWLRVDKQSRSTCCHLYWLQEGLWLYQMDNPCNILFAYGIPPRLHNAVMVLYYGAKVVVTTTDGEADPFHPSAGILQGDTLDHTCLYWWSTTCDVPYQMTPMASSSVHVWAQTLVDLLLQVKYQTWTLQMTSHCFHTTMRMHRLYSLVSNRR